MRFSIIQDRANSPFIFQLLSNEDEVLLTSQAYPTRDACTDGIRAAIDALRNPESFGIQAGNTLSLRGAAPCLLARQPHKPLQISLPGPRKRPNLTSRLHHPARKGGRGVQLSSGFLLKN